MCLLYPVVCTYQSRMTSSLKYSHARIEKGKTFHPKSMQPFTGDNWTKSHPKPLESIFWDLPFYFKWCMRVPSTLKLAQTSYEQRKQVSSETVPSFPSVTDEHRQTDRRWDKAYFGTSDVQNLKICKSYTILSNVCRQNFNFIYIDSRRNPCGLHRYFSFALSVCECLIFFYFFVWGIQGVSELCNKLLDIVPWVKINVKHSRGL